MCGGTVISNSKGKHVAKDLSAAGKECPLAGGMLSFFCFNVHAFVCMLM
jgi:hypothetical protein